MISFWRIFWLELTTLARSKTWLMLLLASTLWMLLFPRVMTGDGTAEGTRELYVHYSLGGVFALLVVSLLASATGSIANERTAKRLQLTLIRPVRHSLIALAKALALLVVGVSVLALSAAILYFDSDRSVVCSHVLSPVMESPRAEAEKMYQVYLKDPNVSERIRHAKKSAVVRLLTQKAVDRYDTLSTNSVTSWRFDGVTGAIRPKVRMRFTNTFETRQEVRGTFVLGGAETIVSNVTQAVLTLPIEIGTGPCDLLSFRNEGKSALMLRPRRDLNLLIPADSFGWNLLRATLELSAILALVIALGLFLSSGLGRPVALFVAFSALIVSEMSPSVVEQYPDELEAKFADRVGLYITRFAAEITRPIATLSPLEPLSKDECVEWRDVMRLILVDLISFPILFALLAGLTMSRKTED